MIPDDVVEEVRERADIVDVIGEFLDLKRAGKDYKALCPFHDEKTPSFYVVPGKGFYNCFGCGESGDAFSFLMKRQGMEFVDAVKHVGHRSGVEVREVRSGSGQEDPHRYLYETNAFARRFFQERLADPKVGERARAYLESRGIDDDAVERYGLGFAPDGWRTLRDAAHTHGIQDETLLEVGLLKTSEKAAEPYDRFRNRIVFPIESPSGRVLGFGGRILPAVDADSRGSNDADGPPKYLNSPESPIYHKGDVLYGLGWAKHAVRREESALMVEGYMDAVALGAAGLEHVVAPLGTSLTEVQADLLRRYTTRVYLLFDSDAAGLRATFRAADILLEAGLHPQVVTLPPGEDPDSVVRRDGLSGIRGHLDAAVDVLDRKLQILDERDYFSSIERTRSAVDRLLPTLRAAADPTLRDIYVDKVATRTGVRRETLEEEMSANRGRRRAGAASGSRAGSGTHATSGRGRGRSGDSEWSPGRSGGRSRGGSGRRGTRIESDLRRRMGPERSLLWVLLHDPDRTYRERAVEQIGPEDFTDPAYRTVFELVIQDDELSRVPEGIDPRAASVLEELLEDDHEASHIARQFQESVNRIRQRPLQAKKQVLHGRLAEAEERGDREAVGTILDELDRLRREQKDLGGGWESSSPGVFRVGRSNQTDESR